MCRWNDKFGCAEYAYIHWSKIVNEAMTVWVFNGERVSFACAVFSSLELAEHWITAQKVSGILTEYPLDTSVYDWALNLGYFKIKREDQTTAKFIQRFSSASQTHYHYEHGIRRT